MNNNSGPFVSLIKLNFKRRNNNFFPFQKLRRISDIFLSVFIIIIGGNDIT